MSELSRRIQDRTPTRPPVLDRHDAERVEARLLTYGQARYETTARLRIENELLREQGQRLAADNAALAVRIEELEAENRRLHTAANNNDQVIESLATGSFNVYEQLVVAERMAWFWFGLAVILAILCAAFLIWD